MHYENIKIYVSEFLKDGYFVTKDNYKSSGKQMKSIAECLSYGKEMLRSASRAYRNFTKIEKRHGGDGKRFPKSPQPTSKDNRKGRDVPCSKW